MKAMKIIGIATLVLLLALVIAMFVIPTAMNVERSVEINAPKEVIKKYVTHLQLMNEWSPWMKMDPNAKNEYIGEDGTIGSIHKWEGNDSVGVGEQEIMAIGDDTIKTQVRFKKPFESTANAFFVLEETENNSVKVTWGFESTMPRPFNVFGIFMNMEESIGNDYQKGLDSLKAVTERNAVSEIIFGGFNIKQVTFPETNFATIRDTLKWTEIDQFYSTNLPLIFDAVTKSGKQPGAPSGLMYVWDETNQQTDIALGIVYSPVGVVPGYSTVTLSGKALKVDYYGSYENSVVAHTAVDGYLKEKGITAKYPVLEQYVTGPATEPDTTKWLTEIYYFLQ